MTHSRPNDAGLVEVVEGTGERPVLLLCDHAGHKVPEGIGHLGIDQAQLCRHIGWDIGAAEVTRGLAKRLGVGAILNHASRLLIDPNRRPLAPTSIPHVSDGCVVPGNGHLTRAEARRRAGEHIARITGAQINTAPTDEAPTPT